MCCCTYVDYILVYDFDETLTRLWQNFDETLTRLWRDHAVLENMWNCVLLDLSTRVVSIHLIPLSCFSLQVCSFLNITTPTYPIHVHVYDVVFSVHYLWNKWIHNFFLFIFHFINSILVPFENRHGTEYVHGRFKILI